jgi:HD-GYP domain-containing protein (c-di-GMP phosphodiesterase class II)
VLKKIPRHFLIVLCTVSTGLLGVLVSLVYPSVFNYTPTLVTLLAYVPIALAAGFFALRGAVPVALFVALVVGVMGVQQGSIVVNPFWWQTSSLYMLFAGAAGSFFELLRPRSVKAPVEPRVLPSPLDVRLLTGLVSALKLRDRATQSHSEWVAQNAFVVGRELGLGVGGLETLYWAALLHDLGKISVPDSILFKAGSLSEAEYTEVKRHPDYGAKLLLSLSADFADIAEIVKCHHERWNGGGYPQGISGNVIPLPSRIIAVVDVFEALTNVRPYRSPIPAEHALIYLAQEAGAHFDPDVVRTFLLCFQRGEIRYAQSTTKNAKTKTLGLDELIKEVSKKN